MRGLRLRGLVWGRLGLLLAGLGVLSVSPLGPGATEGAEEGVYRMVFPLLGEARLTDSFGDPRGRSRHHEGVDVLAAKGTPVVAVADGTVRWVHDGRRGSCCDVAIRHRDGWRSRYIHLNNDTPGSDDGRAVGIAPGIRPGAAVVAGQLLGWVGDSGNAEETVPHLHFELRRPNGTPVDPLPSLRAAQHTGRALAPPRDTAETEAGGAEPGGLLGWLAGAGSGDEVGADEVSEDEESDSERSAEAAEPDLTPGGEPTVARTPASRIVDERESEATSASVEPAGRVVEATVAGDAVPSLPGEEIPLSTAAPGAPPGLASAHRVERLRLPPARRPSTAEAADDVGTADDGGAASGGREASPAHAAQEGARGGLSCFGFRSADRTRPSSAG